MKAEETPGRRPSGTGPDRNEGGAKRIQGGGSRRPALLAVSVFPPGPEERRRVLVVDDEPGMRYMTRRVLEKNFEVSEAATGEEALKTLEGTPFNIAVVDVRLPGLSGLDLLSAIKNCCPSTDVIVMTGSADVDEALEVSIRRKAFFFLRKPFPMSVLETLVERVAETQELEETLVHYARDLERNLESARKFQRRMLPPAQWRGDSIRVASLYQASERLSGDFFDYWSLPGGGTALFVADVMGHGPPSAMVTGIVKSQVRSLATELPEPGEVLRALEEELARIELRPFLTAFLLFDRPKEGTLAYAGAGHLPALLYDAEARAELDVSPLPSSAPPRVSPHGLLGLYSAGLPINTGLPIAHRETATIRRTAGLRLLLHTDGYPEAPNATGTPFDEEESPGRSPFTDAVRRAFDAASPEEGIDILEASWKAYVGDRAPDDDRAAVIAWLE